MPSVLCLDNLHCTTCSEITLHRARRCVTCDTPNNQSGARPVPLATPRNTVKPIHYQARAEAAAARRRARAARGSALARSRT